MGSASGRTAPLALTPNAVIRRFSNSILPDAAGGLVSVLIGLCDGARSLCCFPFVGPVDRGDEGYIGDAIALDRRKDRIDGVAIATTGTPERRRTREQRRHAR